MSTHPAGRWITFSWITFSWITISMMAVLLIAACDGSDGTTEPTTPPVVPNQPPTAATVPTQEILASDTLRIRAADYFTDPDGDRLTYQAFTSNDEVATVRIEGDVLVVEAVDLGRALLTWLARDPSGAGTMTQFDLHVILARSEDHAVLVAIYEALNGAEWRRKENWLSHEPISLWEGVRTDRDRRVLRLSLPYRNLQGNFPPQLGQLTRLESVSLSGNELTGPLPEELVNLPDLQLLYIDNNQLTGDLALLERLDQLTDVNARGNGFTGRIPEGLANRQRLGFLDLGQNRLTGPIPTGLGELRDMRWLRLDGNELTGPIPPDLGQLPQLYSLDLSDNRLTGPIPPGLGQLPSLEDLDLGDNDLTGPIPATLGGLSRLRELSIDGNDLEGGAPPELSYLRGTLDLLELDRNPRLTGPIPSSWTELHLQRLMLNGTGLCLPSTEEFRQWRIWTPRLMVRACGAGAFPLYLTQAIQSFDYPVPLVAGDSALLRVFPTTDGEGSFPAVTARFYLNDAEVHAVDIPSRADPIPAEIDESDLRNSANAVVPAEVIQPGLEVVVDIDPDGEADAALGVTRRIPETGRVPVDVRAMPVFHMMAVPFIVDSTGDAHVAQLVEDLHPDHDYLWPTRDLMPIGEIQIHKHDPVQVSSPYAWSLLGDIEAIRVLEGTNHYYAGFVNTGDDGFVSGIAWVGGKSSVQDPRMPEVLAHEIGHNLSLDHAPACDAFTQDFAYPHAGGQTGTWGYDFRVDSLRPPDSADLMSYCESRWVSDYHFTNAMAHRGRVDAWDSASAARVLLVRGGVAADGSPYLYPVFDMEAYPYVPREDGPYRVTGYGADGGTLFSVRFDMLHVADGGGAGFAFTLPVEAASVDRLTKVTLTGPEGTVTLDDTTDRPSAIVRDRTTGQVRAILSGPTRESLARSVEALLLDDATLDVRRSRGIPR